MTALICEPIRAHRVVVIDALPDTDDMLEVAERLCATEVPREVCITKKLSLGKAAADIGEQLQWLELIRDLTSCGPRVRWSALHIDPDVIPKLRHLAPPELIDTAPETVEPWRTSHFFGMFYWRRGPGFATVLDKRDPAIGSQFVLDDPPSHQVFNQARKTSPRAALETIDARALERLESENIILTVAGWSLALPYRMTHWPVPFTSV